MANKIELEDAKQEYDKHYSEFENFKKAVIEQITFLINKNSIKLAVPIQARIKEFSSLSNKHESGRFNIKKSILELQDLIGIRILILFKRDVENIVKLIEDNFEIVRQYNAEDKLSADQFGYSSKHFIIKIKDDWLSLPIYKNLGKYTGEIQIRTLSQHHWAETSNVLQYKDKISVPREISRSLGRVSALLEMVDLEYERLLNEREKYKEEINKNINRFEKLNVDILQTIFEKHFPPENKSENEPYSELLHEITLFGIETYEELESLINKQIQAVIEIVKHSADNGMLYTFAGIMRTIMGLEDRRKHREITDNLSR